MFLLGLMLLMPVARADDVILGAQIEWWPTASRHLVAPGATLQFHHEREWWGVDGELSFANALERSASARFSHQFVRATVLWSIARGREEIAFQAAVGPALTVHRTQLEDDGVTYVTASFRPGLRIRMGLGGAVKGLAWRWSVGGTTVDWPRTHYDTSFGLGVSW